MKANTEASASNYNFCNDKFGSMTITDQTNLYQEAQRFCQQHQLQPQIAIILQNQMFQQTLRVKQQTIKQLTNNKSVGKIQRNNTLSNNMNTSHVTQNKQKPQIQPSKYKGIITHQIIKPEQTVIKSGRKQASKSIKRKNSKHFQQMYKKYEEIQNKKQLSRKASYEKLPFKPVINNLSRKIVDLIRSTTNKKQESNPHKIYSKKNQASVPKIRKNKKQNIEAPISFRRIQQQS